MEKKRYDLLDTIRGIVLVSMIIYHATWNFVYIYGLPWRWYETKAAYFWQQSICWTFILLSGFCWQLGSKSGRRGLTVFLAGILVTVVTVLFVPEEQICFGILTLLGSCMLLLTVLHPYCQKIPAEIGMILSALLFVFMRNVNRGYLGFEGWNLYKLPENLYQNLFSKRQQIALMALKNAISELPDSTRSFFEDTLISIAHCGKYTDYRSKSQDNHCPENRLKETNLYHRFLEKLSERKSYISSQYFDLDLLEYSCMDYRRFMHTILPNTVDFLLTDPPYGDNAQYFEHAQRIHPLMDYSLCEDEERLSNEVVISNAPARTEKHGKEQFLADIERLFMEAKRIVKDHGFMVLYFRPQQREWISDLNKLKDFGRRHGFEPLLTISAGISDPSMRALASAAWTFKNDVCFIFLKLQESERRWYEGQTDVDELVFLAAQNAATDQGNPFVITQFNQEFLSQLRRSGLMRLANPAYQSKILRTLDRYTTKNGAQYRLTGLSPYTLMNREMNAEIRLREFAPVVIEELTADGQGFTFEEYVIHLASFMENGSREIINQLYTANRLIPELLNVYAELDEEQGKFFARDTVITEHNVEGREHLYVMDPYDFERLIADYFVRRGFVHAEVIGRSGDRGVDVLATNIQGEYELIQCKRYRRGNNIGSTPIQRVHSYMRTRNASRAWVITTSDFTPEGRDEARITNVTIMNGQELIQSLELYYPGQYCL